ncbi:hypothetical protein Hanom_Chr04g00372221 [Helianthus anomalus]
MGGGFYPDGDDDKRWWWFEQVVVGKKIGCRSGGGCGWSLRRRCLSVEGADGGGQIGCGGCCSNNILDLLFTYMFPHFVINFDALIICDYSIE